ncbi:MAG: DNA polymerase III subunit alpha, partial [Anaerolinea sp.]|nr:DNA polymerase III subunit alpha [Anaerolinea sp.]
MYVELHCHSHFSLLDGVSSPEALIARAAALQMPALALTDHDALYGAATFGRAAQAAGVKPIFGAEVTVARPDLAPAIPTWGAAATYHLTLLAENEAGYANLSQLIAAARLRCEKGKAQATWEDLAQHSGGLIALSGCRRGLLAHHLLAGDEAQALRATHDLQNLFGQDRFYVELQRQLRPGDERLVQGLLALAGRAGAPVAASNNVHYAERAGHRLHDVLVAIRSHATLDASHAQRNGNSEAHLKGAGEMARLFADRPDALRRTLEIARRCTVSLRRGVQDLPRFPTGPLSPAAYLRTLCVQAMAERCGADPGDGVQRTLEHELAVIEQLGLANYFLIVWDIMRFARAQGIRCQGRGSAANSLVAFLLGITPIDPLAHGLVFERFLSTERSTAPDIDIDFQADRREEVIQYIYRRYGREHAAMACTFVTYRQRSAVRDVARALNFPPDLIDALAEAADRRGLEEAWRELWSAPAPSAPLDRRTWQLLLHLCNEIQRLPRHLGIHNGGFVLSRQPLAAIAPLEPATMAGRTVVQWDKEGLEDVGMVKIDVLGL